MFSPGLCEDSYFDIMYGFIHGNQEDSFFGFRSTEIKYNKDKIEWRLILHGNPNTYAVLKKDSPVGFNEWHIINDTCNGQFVSYNTTLNFNSCWSSEYSCHDGSW